MRCLIVEDDDALRAILEKQLTKESYAVDACGNGTDGLDFAITYEYDCIILDIMLPGMDGLSVLSALRARGNNAPVLLLTARDAVSDRVRGLDLGADDYLVKPFAYEELSARIRALLRKHSDNRSPILRLGELEMDTSLRTVRRGSRLISLTSKEFSLLEYLLRNQNTVLSAAQLFEHVWNGQSSYDTNLVPVYIGYLRGKIDKGEDTPYLHTVRGFGYTLREEKP
ncbi:MAG: response regulator transcription factor [Clostridia bacterium]|nr:response regulator transcription factor [Clostridia bacterium]